MYVFIKPGGKSTATNYFNSDMKALACRYLPAIVIMSIKSETPIYLTPDENLPKKRYKDWLENAGSKRMFDWCWDPSWVEEATATHLQRLNPARLIEYLIDPSGLLDRGVNLYYLKDLDEFSWMLNSVRPNGLVDIENTTTVYKSSASYIDLGEVHFMLNRIYGNIDNAVYHLFNLI